jgi:crossover junction endodeoxyribonuclease RuvC
LVAHAYGTLRFNTKIEANERLIEIYRGVKKLIEEFKPTHVAIEKVFFAKNVVSALKLGQARGAAILAVAEAEIPIFEYSPNAIKQAVVGFGHADKEQVAQMVTRLLGVKDFASTDTSDALAIAICHLHTYTYQNRIQKALREL